MKRTSLFTRYPTTVWVRLFGELVTQLSLSMIAPFLILYLNEQAGSSVPLTMLVIGLQPASEIALTLIAGGVTDRYGRKSVMLVALGLQALALDQLLLLRAERVAEHRQPSVLLPVL